MTIQDHSWGTLTEKVVDIFTAAVSRTVHQVSAWGRTAGSTALSGEKVWNQTQNRSTLLEEALIYQTPGCQQLAGRSVALATKTSPWLHLSRSVVVPMIIIDMIPTDG